MGKLFFYKDLDSHYIIHLFGIRFLIKHKCKKPNITLNDYGLNTQPREKLIIISLTSYPARIKSVHETIITLLSQKVKPDKVILWLAEDEFSNKEQDLPSELLNLKQYGLEINWCDNLRSYKKLLPALKLYPDDIIITADDDVYYDECLVESLYNAYKKDSLNIYTRRAVEMGIKNNALYYISGRSTLYKNKTYPSFLNQQMGGSGCLYPPHSLDSQVFNCNLLPTHDDAYFWGMAVLNNTKIQIVDGFDKDLLFRNGTQEVGLMHTNKQNSVDGISLKDAHILLMQKYPIIRDRILNGEFDNDK